MDPDVLGGIQWLSKVEVRDVKACKSCLLSCGQDAIEEELYKFEGVSRGASVTGVADLIAPDGDVFVSSFCGQTSKTTHEYVTSHHQSR